MEDLGASSSSQNKRLAIWVIACVLVMVGWSYIAPRPVPPPPERPALPPPAEAPVAIPGTAEAVGAAPAGEAAAAEAGAGTVPAAAEETPRRVTARTDSWDVELSNVGGRITSWKLLQEGDYGDPGQPLEMIRRELPPPAAGVPAPAPGTVPASDAQDVLPLQLVTGDASLDARLRAAVHAVTSESSGGNRVLTARWSDGAGTSVEKILTLLGDAPLATLEARLTVNGRAVPFRIAWGPGLCNHTGNEHSNMYFRRGNIAWLDGANVRVVDRPDKQGTLPEASPAWAAMQDSYFAVLFTPRPLADAGGIPLPGAAAGFAAGGVVPPDERGKIDKQRWPEELLLEVPFTPESAKQSMYVGPRDRPTLRRLEPRFAAPASLTMLTHLGWLDGIARLLHVPMIKFHAWTGSWGIAVILLTLLVRVVIAPMQFYSMKKMKAMQDKMRPMQAKLKALEERYKKQPPSREARTKHMEEKQQLMLEAGVNPADMMSGCLPMLITMPAFFALFKLLPNAPEFRHESFLFWKDLAAADPSHVLPIAAAVLTLVSTKMGMSSNPGAIDPMQRNMLYMFPLMLVWLCWYAPLAFVVYQVAMSAVQIGQQQLFNMVLSPDGGSARAPSGNSPKAAPAVETASAPSGDTGTTAARKKGRKR